MLLPTRDVDLASREQLQTHACREARRRTALVVGWLLTMVVLLGSICVGAYPLAIGEVIDALRAGPHDAGSHSAGALGAVVWDLRLPRILLAAAVGAGLATSGAAYQAAYRNPLVDPSILGVSAGAAFGAGLAVVFTVPFGMAGAAFVGGILAVALTYVLSVVDGARPTSTVILAGVIVGAIFSAGFGLLQYLGTNEQLRRLVFWLLGGFYEARWRDVGFVVPTVVILTCFMTAMGWNLNVLSLGDEDAAALGRDPETLRRRVLVLATALTATAVSVSGIVAWIGLLVPHAARFLVGADNRHVVPMSAAIGAIFAVLSDALARTISTGEIPIGVITSLLGAPFLLYLLRTRGKALVGT